MGAHKTNPNSIMAATLPALLPPGHRAGVDIKLQVFPQANILLMPPERIRAAAEGKTEILVGDPDAPGQGSIWQEPPEGVEVWPLGQPLPPEKCDVVAVLATAVEDMTGPRMLVVPGQPPRGLASLAMFAELGRAPLVEWQARHLEALQGPVGCL